MQSMFLNNCQGLGRAHIIILSYLLSYSKTTLSRSQLIKYLRNWGILLASISGFFLMRSPRKKCLVLHCTRGLNALYHSWFIQLSLVYGFILKGKRGISMQRIPIAHPQRVLIIEVVLPYKTMKWVIRQEYCHSKKESYHYSIESSNYTLEVHFLIW